MTGLFETMRVRDGTMPLLERHLARLAASCAALGMQPPAPGLAGRIAPHSAAGDAVVRVTIAARGERIEVRALPEPGPMRVVFSGTRYQPYPHKTTDRAVFDLARSRVVPYRAEEAILLTAEGHIAEGCVTSVFFWLGAELCTPSLDLGILPSIGRARVIEVAARLGTPVREGRFTRTEVEGLPVFLVNSVRGVVETAVHGRRDSSADDRTTRIAAAFWG
jgi:branched-subunit amino acid aminotransferase/4-amino-4-deoxychorismate lyase